MMWGQRYPRDGERRSLRPFAWFPVRTTNGPWVWLEHYDEIQEFRPGVRMWVTRYSWPIR